MPSAWLSVFAKMRVFGTSSRPEKISGSVSQNVRIDPSLLDALRNDQLKTINWKWGIFPELLDAFLRNRAARAKNKKNRRM
jgi:hypothetical protein